MDVGLSEMSLSASSFKIVQVAFKLARSTHWAESGSWLRGCGDYLAFSK